MRRRSRTRVRREILKTDCLVPYVVDVPQPLELACSPLRNLQASVTFHPARLSRDKEKMLAALVRCRLQHPAFPSGPLPLQIVSLVLIVPTSWEFNLSNDERAYDEAD